MKDIKKLLFALSLSKKAGKVISGTDMVVEAIRGKNQVFLVLLSSDASENSKKKIKDKSAFYAKKIAELDIDGFELAKSIGKDGSISSVAITDENLAKLIEQSL